MRPEILFPLFAETTKLPGVGPKLARLIERAAGPKVLDLLWHLPTGVVDRRNRPKLAAAVPGEVVTLLLRVDRHQIGAGRSPSRVACHDETGSIDLVFFHGAGEHLKQILPVGSLCGVSGRIEAYQGRLQMAHPDHVVPAERIDEIARIEPVYALTAGLTTRAVSRFVGQALERAPVLDEWLDPHLVRSRHWPRWHEAIAQAHQPQSQTDLHPGSPVRERLAYDELLAGQLALALVRRSARRLAGRPVRGDGRLRRQVEVALPFALTGAQRRSLAEIDADMGAPERMLRLLQGDVGSGKTIVAALAMLNAVEAGTQAALLAPTEILARQHVETLRPILEPIGVRLAVLTGRDKGKVRARTLQAIATGEVDIAIGTHALIQEDVVFNDLALAVIDEQHKFGVHQRLALSDKGRGVDILVMTATPIPRTLQLTAYGDMDSSRLDEKPPGRRPVDTRTVSAERLDDVIAAVGRRLDRGGKIYWVCPLVEESENVDLAAATERHRLLFERFGERVGLVHGRMKGPDKDAVMTGFAEGRIDLLVATSVIEVGVNVPSATVMVIEHADRFGLAQLHQLRGRIGRGSEASTCLLLFDPPLSETAKARLEIMRETEDGFRIAEEDLRLRGAGEMLGTRQSGLPEMRVADLAAHGVLLRVARDDSTLILNSDADLESARGRALRVLLYLFERDAAVRLLRAG